MKRWLLVLLLHCSVWGDPLPSATPEKTGLDGRSLARIQKVVEEAIAAGKTPGAVVLLGRRGHIVYRRAFGQRSVEPREVMTAETVFDLASLTKPVATAPSIMIELAPVGRLLHHEESLRRLQAGETPEQIEKSWQTGLESFRARRKPFLLYP